MFKSYNRDALCLKPLNSFLIHVIALKLKHKVVFICEEKPAEQTCKYHKLLFTTEIIFLQCFLNH